MSNNYWRLFLIFVFIYILLFKWIDLSNIEVLLYAYIFWFFALFGAYYYWKTLFNSTSPGTLASIMKLQMVFAFIVWVLIFHERLSWLQLLWHAVIFWWAMHLALKEFNLTKSKNSYILPLIAVSLWTVSLIWMDYLYTQHDMWSILWIQSLGLVSGALILLFFTQWGKDFSKDFRLRTKQYLLIWIATETFWIGMHVFDAFAYSTWPLSKVTFLRETYPVFLILIALSLRPYFPKYIADEWGDSKFEKITVVIIMLVGVYLTIR